MRVLVAGVGKSGTTALAYAIHAGMPADTALLFEPRSPMAVTQPNVLAKILLNPRHGVGETFVGSFDKVVLIVRDPRDIVVSKTMYRVFNEPAIYGNPANLQRYLAAVREKEADPRSWPMVKLNALLHEFSGKDYHAPDSVRALLGLAIDFHTAHAASLVYSYECMVEGDYSAVTKFIGLPVRGAEVPPELARVARSRRAGNWRHWFCPEDVQYYRPMLRSYMEHFGYADDWALCASPIIRPEEATAYVQKLVAERNGFKAR